MAFLADPLSITMCLFVTGVGALIHLYAIGYMHGDPKFSKFFLYLNLFALLDARARARREPARHVPRLGGRRNVLVLPHRLLAHAGVGGDGRQEGVRHQPFGDCGFMVAMFLAFQALGSVSFARAQRASRAGHDRQDDGDRDRAAAVRRCRRQERAAPAVPLAARRDGGPDAGVGADPRRDDGDRRRVPDGPHQPGARRVAPTGPPRSIAWVGAITALFAATIAVAQNDIKKVLAYSTVSQLGYMFLAVGSGAYVAAMFHMVTHAFFKALLFLGSGSVIHGMHDEQDMRRMGALRKFMPITAATFIVGWLAIAGVPPFAGFWSKDEILLFALAPARPVGRRSGHRPADRVLHDPPGDHGVLRRGQVGEPRRRARARTASSSRTSRRRSMLFPLVVARRPGDRRRHHPPAVRVDSRRPQHRLEYWLHPVVESGEAEITGGSATTTRALLALVAIAGGVGRDHAAYRGVREAQGAKADRAASVRRWLVRTTRRSAGSWAGPGARRSRPSRGSTQTWSTAPSTAPAGPCAVRRGAAPQGPDRLRAQLRRHPRDRCRASCSAGSCSPGESCDAPRSPA